MYVQCLTASSAMRQRFSAATAAALLKGETPLLWDLGMGLLSFATLDQRKAPKETDAGLPGYAQHPG